MLFHLKNSNLKNSKYICTFLKCLCYSLIFFHFATDINYIFNKVLCIFCRAVDTLRTFINRSRNSVNRTCYLINVFL